MCKHNRQISDGFLSITAKVLSHLAIKPWIYASSEGRYFQRTVRKLSENSKKTYELLRLTPLVSPFVKKVRSVRRKKGTRKITKRPTWAMYYYNLNLGAIKILLASYWGTNSRKSCLEIDWILQSWLFGFKSIININLFFQMGKYISEAGLFSSVKISF